MANMQPCMACQPAHMACTATLLVLLQVIVMSRKPEFFSYNMPLYEVVTPDGLMRPVLAAKLGGLYCGGSARQVRVGCCMLSV